MLHRLAVDFPDLVTDVQRRLPVDHATVHDPGDDAPAVFGHFQRDALWKEWMERMRCG